ncbi:Peptidase S11, D-alanyl-D-alanine carboxypeptidase A [Syntrophomonas zehnderi OL-4]|uniref:serine-type D-Ala-D-Ala carboxypeptidase n=1 Tax=Syntrophomonas zehnderi OL-4 TaxID=690567 RepID=A0A0E3W356_9FIRM|nr:D-alanyl-D-alanine carboxypeptidase family protein [Syntrophomonas zehnderi]CFX51351.1 Peptidase S11, D-alanyl-D-alanine carboxypeptidase A [Syntrophomonas zehnderi OL-4]
MIVKKWLPCLLCLIFIISLTGPALASNDLENVKAEAYILTDADSGQVLLAQNEHKRLPPASMTKLMTMLLAVEALEEGRVSLKEKVATSEYAANMGGSQIYLAPGEEMTFEDMLIAIAVGSANDASVAVGEKLAGSNKAFVAKMNAKAKQLGMKNTHFVNANGLHAEDHYTSAADMAILARNALNYPRILEYTSIKEYPLRDGKFILYNTNKLLWWYKGADGFKTGRTEEAKNCLTSTAKQDGLRLISVVMASPETRGHFRDSMQIFNYGFAKYAYKIFVPQDSVAGMVTVGKGNQDKVEAVAAQDAGSIFEKGEKAQITNQKILLKYVDAPVKKGQKLGEVRIYKNGKQHKTVDLIANTDIKRGGITNQIKKMFVETYLL